MRAALKRGERLRHAGSRARGPDGGRLDHGSTVPRWSAVSRGLVDTWTFLPCLTSLGRPSGASRDRQSRNFGIILPWGLIVGLLWLCCDS